MSAVQPQTGGGKGSSKVLEEVHIMSGHVILVVLVLLSAYVSRIPSDILDKFNYKSYQLVGLFLIMLLTVTYGIIHGILATLALVLIISRANRNSEKFSDYVPSVFLTSEGIAIDKSHRWLSEKILNEYPTLIRERDVKTSAIQNLGETSGRSSSSR
jgi:hypothetical protein